MPMPQSLTRSMRSRETAIAVVFTTMLLLLKKLILSNTGWTNLSIERKFLFSENKFYFRFFRETQDLKVIFPRNTGSKSNFSAKHRIFFPRNTAYIRAFIKRLRIIKKTTSGFFWFFVGNKKCYNCYKRNWFNKQLVQ